MGSFGYTIDDKIRFMQVKSTNGLVGLIPSSDAKLLWHVCTREIYLLLKHYGSVKKVRQLFEQLQDATGEPSQEAIEKCRVFMDLTVEPRSEKSWYCLLKHCQYSYINMLESGYILNNGDDQNVTFMLDFNTETVKLYSNYKNYYTECATASLVDIMQYTDMPTKSMQEIVSDMRERYMNFNNQFEKIQHEKNKMQEIIERANELGIDKKVVLDRARKIANDLDWEKRILEMKYRFFYHRMDAIGLIDHSI